MLDNNPKSYMMAIQWGREQKSKLGGSKIPEYCSNFLLNHHIVGM